VITAFSKPSSSSCDVLRRSNPLLLVKNVLRRILNIHARKFVPSRKALKPLRDLANVSCTGPEPDPRHR
jgi:hypothetical protein